MIIITTKSVKSFKEKASKILSNNVLPIYDYVHIVFSDSICTMTKINNSSFVREEFEAEGKEDQSFLVPSIDLFSFVDHNPDQVISIKKVKNKILLIGDNSTTPCVTIEDEFPELEVPEETGVELSPIEIKSIKKASNMLAKEQFDTWRSHVFVGNNTISGSDGFIAYSVPCEVGLNIILRKEVINALPDVGAVYKHNKTYDFFECGMSLYGFKKSDQAFVDMAKMIKIPKADPFILSKKEVVSFNDWILDVSKKPECADVTWDYKEGVLNLVGFDSLSEKTVERKVKIAGGESFKYLPLQMNKILKSIDDDTFICYKGETSMCFTNESKSFISLIQQIK